MSLNIIAGAVCGAVAALLVYALLGRTKLSDRTKGITSFIIFWGLFSFIKAAGIPAIERYEAWNKLEQMPLFVALKAYEPAAFQELKNDFDATAQSQDYETLRVKVGSLVSSIAMKRLPKASNEAAYDTMMVTIDSVDALYKRGDDTCYQYLYKEQFPKLRLEEILPPELQIQDQRAMAEVLRSATQEPQTMPSEESVSGYLQEALANMAESEVGALNVLGNKATVSDRRSECALLSKMYRAILAMPKPQAGQTLRYVLGVGA